MSILLSTSSAIKLIADVLFFDKLIVPTFEPWFNSSVFFPLPVIEFTPTLLRVNVSVPAPKSILPSLELFPTIWTCVNFILLFLSFPRMFSTVELVLLAFIVRFTFSLFPKLISPPIFTFSSKSILDWFVPVKFKVKLFEVAISLNVMLPPVVPSNLNSLLKPLLAINVFLYVWPFRLNV